MDMNSMMLNEHAHAYITETLGSARPYQPGTGSVLVAIIGGAAALLRRAATRIEAWAKGSSDGRIAPRQLSAR